MNATPFRSISGFVKFNARMAGLATAMVGAVFVVATLAGCQDIQTAITPASELSRAKGIELYNAHNLVDAEAAFNAAVRQQPRDYQSHYYLGRTYDALHSYQQAIQSYHTALAVMDNDLRGRDDTAMRDKVLDGLAIAIANSEEQTAQPASARQLSAKSAEDQFVLAKVLRIRGDADGSLEAYDRATRLAPGNLTVAKEYALYLDQLGQHQRARPCLVHAYQLNRKADNAEDVQINEALRRCGVVPGPGLLETKDLAKPVLPMGPLPEVQNPFNPAPETTPAPAAAPQ